MQNVWDTINASTTSGTLLATLLNDFKNSVISGMSGVARPTQISIGGLWVDTSVADTLILKMYDGTADITLMSVNKLTGAANISSVENLFTIKQVGNNATGAILKHLKNRIANLGKTIAEDELGVQEFYGRTDAGVDTLLAKIRVVCNEDTTATEQGSRIEFHAIADDGTTLSKYLEIKNGNVYVTNHLYGDDATFTGDVVIQGNLNAKNYYDGEIVEYEDASIVLNKGGTQATANSNVAGFKVEMSDATHFQMGYDSTLASKVKAGAVGSLKELVNVDSVQDVSNKAIINPSRMDVKKGLLADLITYATTAGNGQFCFATDEKKMFQIVDGVLASVGGGLDAWVTSEDYVANISVVHHLNKIYICQTTHTSGVFATDLADDKWIDENNIGGTDGHIVQIDENGSPESSGKAVSDVAFKNEANTFTAIQKYNENKTFTLDAEIVAKKYVDDGLDGKADLISGGVENRIVTIDAATNIKDSGKLIGDAAFKNENNVFSANQELNSLSTFDDGDELSLVPNKMVDIRAGKNHVRNGHFEVDAAGWSASSANITIARNTTTPISGVADGVITISTSATTSDYVQYGPMTFTKNEQANILTLFAKYFSDANYLDDKLGVYFYDATNDSIDTARTADQSIKATSLVSTLTREFQIPSNCVSGYIRFKVDATVASEAKVYIDNVEFSEKPVVRGAFIGNWKPYTATIAPATSGSITPSTITAYWRENGSDIEIFSDSLAITSVSSPVGDLQMTIPSGISMDNAQYPSDGVYWADGDGVYYDQSVTTWIPTNLLLYPSTGKVRFFKSTATAIPTPAAGDAIVLKNAKFKVKGWSSNMVLSEDAGNRRVAFYGAGGSNQTLTADVTPISWTTIEDTTASMSSGSYTFPETGDYDLSGAVRLSAAAASGIYAWIDGVRTKILNSLASVNVHSINGVISGIKGQVLTFRSDIAVTTSTATASLYWVTIAKRSSPQTIAASEKFAFIARDASGQAVTNGNTITWDTISLNTHNAYSAGVVTVPKSGIAKIKCNTRTQSVATAAAGNSYSIGIKVNGTAYIYGKEDFAYSTTARTYDASIATEIYCVKGTTLALIFSEDISAVNMATDVRFNFLSITME